MARGKFIDNTGFKIPGGAVGCVGWVQAPHSFARSEPGRGAAGGNGPDQGGQPAAGAVSGAPADLPERVWAGQVWTYLRGQFT
jgi:hypothetical protein